MHPLIIKYWIGIPTLDIYDDLLGTCCVCIFIPTTKAQVCFMTGGLIFLHSINSVHLWSCQYPLGYCNRVQSLQNITCES